MSGSSKHDAVISVDCSICPETGFGAIAAYNESAPSRGPLACQTLRTRSTVEAEERAILLALEEAERSGFERVLVKCDHAFAVSGKSDSDSVRLRSELLRRHPAWRIKHVHRDRNQFAHRLAKETMRREKPLCREEPLPIMNRKRQTLHLAILSGRGNTSSPKQSSFSISRPASGSGYELLERGVVEAELRVDRARLCLIQALEWAEGEGIENLVLQCDNKRALRTRPSQSGFRTKEQEKVISIMARNPGWSLSYWPADRHREPRRLALEALASVARS